MFPFHIKERHCVNCGRNGTFQVIHIDRIKGAKSQTLSGETEEDLIPDMNMPNGVQTDLFNLSEEKEQEGNEEQGSTAGKENRDKINLG